MKLLLNIQNGSLSGQQFELFDGFLTIGRAETCAVRFDPHRERIASKQHCFIEAKPDGFYLIDNNSTNGTYLNGQEIQIIRLNSGDVIQFGRNGSQAIVTISSEQDSQPTVLNRQFPPTYIPQQNPVHQSFQPPPVNFMHSMSGLSGRNVEIEQPKISVGKQIGIAFTILGIVFLSLIVMVLMVANVGIIPAIIATVVAFTPAMIYLLPFLWLDRYDPEPLWLVALAFAWGALVAVIISYVMNTYIGSTVAEEFGRETGQAVSAVISAPIFEEGSKGFGLLILLFFFRKYFDDILDGIVFAGVIALGFATVENVLYYGSALLGGGFLGMFLLFLLRGILSPFAHATFTSMTGIGCGISRESHNNFVKIIFPVLGYFGAVLLHAIWNGLAYFGIYLIRKLNLLWICESIGMTGEFEDLCGFLITYGILEVPLFFVFFVFTLLVMRRQNKILKEMLAIYEVQGVIPPDHVKIATSAFRSTGWLLGGIFSGKFRARSRYLRSVGKLGLSNWHIQRANEAKGQTGSFQQNPILREEVVKWRDLV